MSSDRQKVLDIVERIYASVSDGAAEPLDGILGEIARVTASEYSMMQVVDLSHRRLDSLYHSGLPPAIIELFHEEFVKIDPRIEYTARRPPNTFVEDSDFIDDRSMDRSRYYMEFLRPFELRYFGCMIFSSSDNATQTAFTVQRTAGQGLMKADERDAFVLVGRHLSNAAALGNLLGESRGQVTSMAAALDASTQAMALVDAAGRVVFANRALYHLAQKADGWRLTDTGIAISHPAVQSALTRLIVQVTQSGDGKARGGGGRVLVPKRDGGRACVMSVMPIARGAFGLRRRGQGAAAIVSVVDPDHRADLPIDILRDIFKLSRAEARVVLGLTGRNTIADLAFELGVSPETVRTQLRKAMAKTETTTRGDLLALLERLTRVREPGSVKEG